MLREIKLLHIEGDTSKISIDLLSEPGAFILKTCQRALIIKTSDFLPKHKDCGHYYTGKEAYHFLLQTICGLKSKLKGESEIVSQFKEAYQNYLSEDVRSSTILKVLQKLFKDAKEIRSNYLVKIGQQSYAGIARKLLQTHNECDRVLILGSGQLAKDLIKQLGKRFSISISARNGQKVDEILNLYPKSDIQVIPWSSHTQYISYANIVNTIGTEITLFGDSFFQERCSNSSLFIDLGSPSAIQTSKTSTEGVFRLNDIFSHAKKMNLEKENKLKDASQAIESIVEKRERALATSIQASSSLKLAFS